MIRHAGTKPGPVGPLAISMIEPAFGAALIKSVRPPVMPGVALPAAGIPAVGVAPVTAAAEKERPATKPAGADRGVIERGAQMLGIEINDLISDVIMGMRQVAPEIGLG